MSELLRDAIRLCMVKRKWYGLEPVAQVVPKDLTSFVQDDMGIKRVSDSRMS